MADIRLIHPFAMFVFGPSQCGKSHFVCDLIRHRHEAIVPIPRTVIWAYKYANDKLDSMLKQGT